MLIRSEACARNATSASCGYETWGTFTIMKKTHYYTTLILTILILFSSLRVTSQPKKYMLYALNYIRTVYIVLLHSVWSSKIFRKRFKIIFVTFKVCFNHKTHFLIQKWEKIYLICWIEQYFIIIFICSQNICNG